MALPENSLSELTGKFPYSYTRDLVNNLLIDYEMGGIQINDASQGHTVQIWRMEIKNFREVWLSAEHVPEFLFMNLGVSVTSASFTFDQNMQPVIAYESFGSSYLFWYDANVESYVITNWGNTVRDPKVTLDDKRDRQVIEGNADVLFAYVKNNNLYYRQQRERYTQERLLKENVEGTLLRIGMDNQNRVQFEFGIKKTEEEFFRENILRGDPVTSLGHSPEAEVQTYKPSATIWKPGD